MEFLLINEEITLEGDIIIEEIEEKKEKKENPWVLDISESVDWIKESKTKYNNPQFKNPKYKGPTNTSNFVTDNLYMGGYPSNKADVDKLLSIGINTFVCLNGADKKQFYKYEDDLPKNINYINEPIQDMSITTDEKIISLCQNIVHRIKVKGDKIFVHCAGGHGRTGTVVSCVLYLLYKLSLEQILDYLQFTHDQRDGNWFGNSYYTPYLNSNNPFKKYYVLGQVPVPQKEIQLDQIKRVISNQLLRKSTFRKS
jgi:protein-tyrosine phosphatase